MHTHREFLNVLGATESAINIIDNFRKISSRKDRGSVLEAIEYLYKAYKTRRYSALLINTTRKIFEKLLEAGNPNNIEDIARTIDEMVERIIDEVNQATDRAAEIMSKRIEDGDVIITLSYSGSVLKAIKRAHDRGSEIEVIVSESRPIGEGLEMAKHLARIGVKTTLIVDSAIRASIERATKAMLGAEAIAANGAVVNKVGSAVLALAAKEARVRLYIVAGTYKILPETIFGEMVALPSVEEEIPSDLKEMGVKNITPLFEAISPDLIDAIATERGFIAPEAIPFIVREVYGSWPPNLKSLETMYSELKSKLKQGV